jgi:molybdenum cofactor cytidylyltransferase
MTRLAAIVLAAGASRRFGAENKLLIPFDGTPLVRRVVAEILNGPVSDVVVVTGCERAAVEGALANLPITIVHNGDWQAGLGSSIAAGVRALATGTDAAFIVPGDLPFLRTDLLRALAAKFEQQNLAPIVFAATREGEQRNPVLWPHRFFPKLSALTGHEGAKRLLRQWQSETRAVIVGDDAAFLDVDTQGDLDAARGRISSALPSSAPSR